MRLFDSYLTELDDVFSRKVDVTPKMLKEQRNYKGSIKKSVHFSALAGVSNELPAEIEGPKVLFKYDKKYLEKYFGTNIHAFEKIKIGDHPDFEDLDDESYLNHHCVSVFVDIKGSTRLIEKYSLLEVRLIKDSLLTLAIQVANQFGGHVHRLQGDGIFLQFVRRDQNQNDAIINALNASSILTQFVSVDLKGIMSQYGLRPLKIRTGIDFGESEKVLWSYYGIPGCRELTTTSLHTDMAAKLQGKANDNSILIGDNIRKTLDFRKDFYSIFETKESREKVFYISRQFTYPFYVFNWEDYLLSLPFVKKNSNGVDLELYEKEISIVCYISNEDGSSAERYYPNSRSIPKNKSIKFYLKRNGADFNMYPNEKRIEWYAFNSGQEAEDAEMLNHDYHKLFINKTSCDSTAAYLGHHYVECRIVKAFGQNERVIFPIFVQ
ncbi:MAG: hypothetical protein ACERIH_02005 [Labilibaculum antarcticum]